MKTILITSLTILLCTFCNGQSTSSDETKQDTLFINLNDKLLFEASFDSNNNLVFKMVGAIVNDSTTVSIELTYNGAAGSMLKVKNPFSKPMHYKAELFSYKKKDYVETSTIPVYPKISAFETWPYKIDKIRLTGFVLKDGE